MSQRKVVWEAVGHPGMEYTTFRAHEDHIYDVTGLIVSVDSSSAFPLSYFLTFNKNFRVEHVQLVTDDRQLHLASYSEGQWCHVGDRGPGDVLSSFDGCIDIDITATPFTNTLPIRRVPWEVGQSREFKMLYVSAPELTLSVSEQRYTCLEKRETGSLFRFELVDGSFSADLPVDADGLVLDYPGLFRRLWTG